MSSLRDRARNALTGDDTDARVIDEQIFGTPGLAALGAGKQVAKPVNIFDIDPDPTQPRRAIPSAVLNSWNYGDPRVLWAYWLDFAQHEMGIEDADDASMEWLHDRALGEYEAHWTFSEQPGPVERALLEVADLASSIYRDGLTNPITVEQQPAGRYRIETGERRWLAFHLLHEVTGDEKWLKIPARLVEKVDAFRQAAENNQRQNLNAISRARQYAILMMALHTDVAFYRYDQCGGDRAYYAQALDLQMPYGQGEKVLAAMGISSRGQLTTYRKLLAAPDEVWRVADDESWPENKVFSVLNSSTGGKSTPTLPRLMPDVQRDYNFLRTVEARGHSEAEKQTIREKIARVREALDAVERKLEG